MPKIVIIGVNTFRNRGVEALSVSICEQVLKRWPEADITVLCKDVGFNRRQAGQLPVTYRDDAYRAFVAKGSYVLGLLFTPIPRFFSADFREVRNIVRSADIVISTGGDNFGQDYGTFQNHLTPFMEAQDAGVLTIFLGQSIGPFKSDGARRLFQRVAQESSMITCRESLSHRFCTAELGLPSDRTVLAADVAFLLEPVTSHRVDDILSEKAIDPDERKIVLSISGGITQFSQQNRGAHVARWVDVIRKLRKHVDARILILPHVWQDMTTQANNDMVASLAVMEALDDPGVVLLDGCFGAAEYKGIIGRADFVVAERMHAAIAGLSQAVPTVAISYSVKADGIIGDIFNDIAEVERPVISTREFIDDPAVTERLLGLYDRRAEIRQALEAALPGNMELAKANFNVLQELVDGTKQAKSHDG